MAKGTLTVNLARDWFAPNGSLYQRRDNPHEFPASWEDQIPGIKKAKARGDAAKEVEYVEDKDARDRIIVGENTRTVATLQRTADGTELVVPTVVEDGVKAVGGALDDKGIEQPAQSMAKAEAGAKEVNAQVGGKPRESGPLPAGTKKP